MSLLKQFNTLVGLVKAVRAYSWTPANTPDEGRDHPLYPSNMCHSKYHLWTAINEAMVLPKRDRESDRLRFPDPDFNRWLDYGISDLGHTVWDTFGDTADAWAGWSARTYYPPVSLALKADTSKLRAATSALSTAIAALRQELEELEDRTTGVESSIPPCDDASTAHIMARIINANPAEI